MKEGFLCIVLLYFLLCITRRASATEYEVDGRIEQTEFNHDGTIRKHTASEFTVYVRDRSWLIHSTDFNPDGVPVYARETGCPNQTEVYEVAGKPNHGFVVSPGSSKPATRGHFRIGQSEMRCSYHVSCSKQVVSQSLRICYRPFAAMCLMVFSICGTI